MDFKNIILARESILDSIYENEYPSQSEIDVLTLLTEFLAEYSEIELGKRGTVIVNLNGEEAVITQEYPTTRVWLQNEQEELLYRGEIEEWLKGEYESDGEFGEEEEYEDD